MDVTDILGISRPNGQDESLKLLLEDNNVKGKSNKKNQTKPKGMSRELFALMGPDGLTPSIQTNQTNLFKDKRQHIMHGKWVWSKFRNSARSDDLQCSHWIKAELQGYDYTYAKFNVKIEPISYKDEEYETLLQNPNWTRSETDHLMFLCYEYDLRWPVIADRYETSTSRSVEELMHRYYFIVSKLKSHRAVHSDFNNRSSASESFNIDYERARRKQQDLLFRKTPAEEAEEARIREELKTIDAALKKLKKTPAPKTSASDSASSSAPQKPVSKTSTSSSAPQPLSAANIITPPIMMYGGGIPSSDGHGLYPSPGFPCLQSARLSLHSSSHHSNIHPDLSTSYMKKLVQLLQELGMPDRLLPTKRICDANDLIRKDCAVLLSLQNTIQKKEKELQSLKAYHESIGKKKDNSFLLPHVTLLSNDLDPSLTDHFVIPAVIPQAEGIIPPPSTLVQPAKPSSKSHRKSTSTGTTKKRKAASVGGEGESVSLEGHGEGENVSGDPKPQATKKPKKQQSLQAATNVTQQQKPVNLESSTTL